MNTSHSLTFSAYETITPSINGYQFELDGITFTFQNLFVESGSVTVHYIAPSQAAEVQIPQEVQASLKIKSQVSHFGITGHTLTNFSFELFWETASGRVVLTGITMGYGALNSFFDALSAVYKVLGELVKQMDMKELAQLAGVSSLPKIEDWDGMPNYSYPAFVSVPNPLNQKEAIADANLPQTVPIISYNVDSLKYYLVVKLTHHKGWITAATIEFYAYPDYGKQGATASLLKTWDVTQHLGDRVLFYYTNYWTASHKMPEGTPLDLYLAGPALFYNSMVQGGPGPVSITFNFKHPELYADGIIFPISGMMVAMPVKK